MKQNVECDLVRAVKASNANLEHYPKIPIPSLTWQRGEETNQACSNA
jgi:hypothetical protein